MRTWLIPFTTLGMVLATAVAAEDLLPVKRGHYAPVGGVCAVDGVLSYDGHTIGNPGLRRCRATASQAGSLTYKVTEVCRGDDGDRAQETTYRINGRSGFSIVGAGAEPAVEYRLCAPPAEPELIRGWTP